MKWPWGRETADQQRIRAERAARAEEARNAATIAATATDATTVAVAELERHAALVAERSRQARERNHIGEMVDAALGYTRGRPA